MHIYICTHIHIYTHTNIEHLRPDLRPDLSKDQIVQSFVNTSLISSSQSDSSISIDDYLSSDEVNNLDRFEFVTAFLINIEQNQNEFFEFESKLELVDLIVPKSLNLRSKSIFNEQKPSLKINLPPKVKETELMKLSESTQPSKSVSVQKSEE